MIKITLFLTPFIFFLNGCFSTDSNNKTIKQDRIELGDIKINYYSDKSVSSLEVPPDLTSPDYQNSFRLSELVTDIKNNTVNLSDGINSDENDQKVLTTYNDIVVKKFGKSRWLEVGKSPEIVWNLAKDFLKSQGFIIKKSNKKIGILETDYRENRKVEIPSGALGAFKAFFASTIENVNYTLPTVDKYKIRIEPSEIDNRSEVYLSISSMGEMVSGEDKTIWQVMEKDYALEAEMLYSFMLFLGSDSANAREKIINAKDENPIKVYLEDALNGYAKIVINMNLSDAWDNISWALNELNIEIEDKDIKEKTYYIKEARTADKGIMSKLFGDVAIKKVFQIQFKSIDTNLTEVYFNDISEENDSSTKEFSYDFFKTVVKLFNSP